MIWYHWLSNSPPVVSHEVLRFCELLKSRFQSGAELRIAERRTKFEEDRLNRYRSLDSVYPKEVEMQLDRVTAVQTDLASALEAENLSILKLQQSLYLLLQGENRMSNWPFSIAIILFLKMVQLSIFQNI